MKKVFSLFALALLTVSAWAANTYVKVTSIDQLEAGMKYILVNEEYGTALGKITGTSTPYGSAIEVTITDGVLDIESTDVVELTLGNGSQDEYGNPTWTFDMYGEGHFLIWTSGNSLNTATGAGPVNTLWYATLTDNGVILKNRADNTRILQYNSGAPRFACYTSNQKAAVLYVQGVPEDEGITMLSQANALEDAAQFTFNGDAVVTAAIGSYMFLRDESGFGMIAGVEGTFENGQVLSQGWNATKTSINDGWVRFTDAAGLSASGETNPELAAAIVLTGAVDESMLNAYVCIENQKMGGGLFPGLPPRSFTLPDGTTIGKTEVLGGINWPASGNHNVYGIICKVNGALVFNALSTAPYVEPQPQGLRGDVNNDTFVTIDDVTALISYLLTDDATGLNLENANCNLDETITIDDVTKLISFLLTDEWD